MKSADAPTKEEAKLQERHLHRHPMSPVNYKVAPHDPRQYAGTAEQTEAVRLYGNFELSRPKEFHNLPSQEQKQMVLLELEREWTKDQQEYGEGHLEWAAD